VEQLERRVKNLKINSKSESFFPLLETVGGKNNVQEVIKDSCGILEYDKENSPFFEDTKQTHWADQQQKKKGVLNEKFIIPAKSHMGTSVLCQTLLGVETRSTIELRKQLMNMKHLQDPPSLSDQDRESYHDELYLWNLVHTLLIFEEQKEDNPLLNPLSLLEGWFMMLALKDIKTNDKKQRVEVLFMEAKPDIPWNDNSVEADRFKLQKEMNDALVILTKDLGNVYDPEMMFFGIQTVGLECKLYVLDVSLHELADFSELFHFKFSHKVSNELREVLMAGCVMLEVKRQIKKFIKVVKEMQQEVVAISDDSSSGGGTGRGGADNNDDDDGGDGSNRKLGSHSPSSARRTVSLSGSRATPEKKGREKGKQQKQCSFFTIDADLKPDLTVASPASRNGQPSYVSFATRVSDGAPVALKNLRRGWCVEDHLVREVGLLWQANCLGVRHVVPLLGAYEPQGRYLRFSMVFPRLLPLNESNRIRSLSLVDVQQIASQLNIALYDLHKAQILHLDVSTSNVMLDAATLDVRLIDFGHAELMYPGFEFLYQCGTVGYQAPEVEIGNSGGPKCDIYSAGVVLLHLLVPFLFSNESLLCQTDSNANDDNNGVDADSGLQVDKVGSFLREWKDNEIREVMTRLARKRAKEVLQEFKEHRIPRSSSDLLLRDLCLAAVNQTRYSTQKRSSYYFGSSTPAKISNNSSESDVSIMAGVTSETFENKFGTLTDKSDRNLSKNNTNSNNKSNNRKQSNKKPIHPAYHNNTTTQTTEEKENVLV